MDLLLSWQSYKNNFTKVAEIVKSLNIKSDYFQKKDEKDLNESDSEPEGYANTLESILEKKIIKDEFFNKILDECVERLTK